MRYMLYGNETTKEIFERKARLMREEISRSNNSPSSLKLIVCEYESVPSVAVSTGISNTFRNVRPGKSYSTFEEQEW